MFYMLYYFHESIKNSFISPLLLVFEKILLFLHKCKNFSPTIFKEKADKEVPVKENQTIVFRVTPTKKAQSKRYMMKSFTMSSLLAQVSRGCLLLKYY